MNTLCKLGRFNLKARCVCQCIGEQRENREGCQKLHRERKQASRLGRIKVRRSVCCVSVSVYYSGSAQHTISRIAGFDKIHILYMVGEL